MPSAKSAKTPLRSVSRSTVKVSVRITSQPESSSPTRWTLTWSTTRLTASMLAGASVSLSFTVPVPAPECPEPQLVENRIARVPRAESQVSERIGGILQGCGPGPYIVAPGASSIVGFYPDRRRSRVGAWRSHRREFRNADQVLPALGIGWQRVVASCRAPTMSPTRFVLATMAILALSAAPAAAVVHVGDPAPAFTKNELQSTPFPQPGAAHSLSDYAGRVLVIHLLGYN